MGISFICARLGMKENIDKIDYLSSSSVMRSYPDNKTVQQFENNFINKQIDQFMSIFIILLKF